MEILVIILFSFTASWLTFFSGFGLGTILTPVFYFLFGDLVLAVACTTIVHFLNNVFKFVLMKKSVDWKVALPFGIAAIPAAFLGAYLLTHFNDVQLLSYTIAGNGFSVELLNLIFGSVLIVFSVLELIPSFSIKIKREFLWIGGLLSGFFGGLSGHQGALRTAFLSTLKLDKEVFVATGIVIALGVDIARSAEYFFTFDLNADIPWKYVFCALAAAFGGAILGKILLKKMNLKILNVVVAISMITFGVLLIGGVLS